VGIGSIGIQGVAPGPANAEYTLTGLAVNNTLMSSKSFMKIVAMANAALALYSDSSIFIWGFVDHYHY
jgi:nitrogen fixation protein FixH